MKNDTNKQPQNVPTRLDAKLHNQIKEKAVNESRSYVTVLNRVVKKGIQLEETAKSSEPAIN